MRYFLDPFGCAKNQVDAELIMARLDGAGWTASEPEDADLLIVNSCGFIEAAKRESINAVLGWKQRYPGKKVLLAGCLARRYRKELEAELTEADGFLGCDELDAAPDRAASLFAAFPRAAASAGAAADGTGTASPPHPPGQFVQPGTRPLLGFPGSAYVKIAEGCDNRCSFCAIPLIRGPLRCRSIPDITDECAALLGRGVRELCLIGQDIAAYKPSLAALLESIAALPGSFWVRLLYVHPDHFPLDILDIMERDRRFLPYFDIPFQHGSSRILAAMGRSGAAAPYLALLQTIRRRLPGAVIRSTFLVGFPGETEDDVEQLLDFQRRARFDWLGVFAWSREEGTPAFSMKGRAAKKTVLARKARVEAAQVPVTEERMDRFVGRVMDMLIEEALPPGADTDAAAPPDVSGGAGGGFLLGRLMCHAPEVDGAAVLRIPGGAPPDLPPGGMIHARVIRRAGFDLELAVTASL